jgi:hypothetical protein
MIAIATDALNDEVDDIAPIDKSMLPVLGISPPERAEPSSVSPVDFTRRLSLKYTRAESLSQDMDRLSIGSSPEPPEEEPSEIFRITTDVEYDQGQLSPDQHFIQEIKSEPSSYPDDQHDGIMYPRNVSSRRPLRPRVPITITVPDHTNLASDEDETNIGTNIFTGVAAESENMHFESLRTPGERTSIMQTISNLWNGNPANFLSLVYPSYII